jgi:hypothetical protein
MVLLVLFFLFYGDTENCFSDWVPLWSVLYQLRSSHVCVVAQFRPAQENKTLSLETTFAESLLLLNHTE